MLFLKSNNHREDYYENIQWVVSLCLVVLMVSLLGCASTATKEGTGEYFDDSVITSKVKAEIFKDDSLKSAEINVETFKGVVQLSGFVNSQATLTGRSTLPALSRG